MCWLVLTSGVGTVVSIKGWNTLADVFVHVTSTTKQTEEVTAAGCIIRSCTHAQGDDEKTEKLKFKLMANGTFGLQ